MEKLTKRQSEILEYIKQFIQQNGYPPTIRELGEGLNLSSTATVLSHLVNLENKGYIKRNQAKNRAIEIINNDDSNQKLIDIQDTVAKIPLLGKVTAGNPIEAIEFPDEYLTIPKDLLPKNNEAFALSVSGQSMINVGIYDGDLVIIERTNTARNGEIVVAMTDDNEVTLKTFYKENNYIRLQPENDHLDPIIVNNCVILGKAKALYRIL